MSGEHHCAATSTVNKKCECEDDLRDSDRLWTDFEVSAACFARRRLPVVMKKIGMVDSIRQASDFVEQGHVRIGPKLVTDPALMVTRNQEDAITWTNASKIKQHVLDYNNARDDFDLA
ncbi:S4 domain protein [Teladorsagia circumcincta]|uniref:U3 small nucleolar ribonucleoprotein protein IMP3 n=1 Tax=Teladorsagia circumcincta TaxID=45464 RepID=A0A2G9UQN4_TELCI|nr:S4 domain protein [Teladorsagia circumcincta]